MNSKWIFGGVVCLMSLVATAAQLLENGSFEQEGSWKFILHNGATGRMERVQNARTGKYAMRIVKTNDRGFCQLVSLKPVKLPKGGNYAFHGYFQTQTSRLDSLLVFRLTNQMVDRTFGYDAMDRSFGYPSQSLLVNTNKGEWYPRLVTNRPWKNQVFYASVLYWGGKGEVLIDDLTVDKARYYRGVPSYMKNRTTYPYTEAQVLKILETRPKMEAWVASQNGKSQLLINGQKAVPCMYKAEPYLDNFVHNRYTEFGQAGVPLLQRPVSLAWILKEKRQYNFKKLDEVIFHALRQYPQANLVISIGTSEPYLHWGEKNLPELWRNKSGNFGWGLWGNCEGFVSSVAEMKAKGKARTKRFQAYGYPSYSSEVYQSDVCQALQDIVTYMMKSPYGKAIVGFHIGGGHDGQFQYFGPDYSQPALKSYRKFLAKRHGSIKNYNRSYRTNYRSFAEVGIPARPQGSPMFYGPYSDYLAFQTAESNNLRHRFARAIRQAAGKKVVISSYGSPVLYHCENFCQDQGGIDIYAVPAWYPYRRAGYPLGAKPEGAFHLHGKMWLHELDLRSWTDWSNDEVYDMWLGSALSLKQWKSVHRKTAGVALAHDYPWWYYTMFRYFDRPEIMKDIQETMNITRKVIDAPAGNFRPDVCVVRSEVSDNVCTYRASSYVISHVVPWQYHQFEISGVPYDAHYLSDILKNPQLQNYKMYVFLHNGGLSAQERQAINQKLRKKGCTLVFMHNTGYVDLKRGKSTEFMKQLTGLKINTADHFARLAAYLCPGHPLTKGIKSTICNGGEVTYSTFALRGDSPHTFAYQVFHPVCANPQEVVGRYSDGTPAIVCRDTAQGRIIYAAPPFALNAEFFNRLARTSGAYVASNPGQSMFMNGKFISLHGVTPGPCTITLPPGVNQVTDLFANKKLSVKNRQVTIDVKVGDSNWYLLEK